MTNLSSDATSTTGSLVSELSTTLLFCSNELPKDGIETKLAAIHRRAKDRKFHFLSRFLSECTEVLKAEVAELHPSSRVLLPQFHNVLGLAGNLDDYRDGPLGGALEGALLCVLQIGMIIGHCEEQGLNHLFQHGSATLAGLSIGLISAAAVSSTSSLAELSLAGTESVRIAFRLGIHVDHVSQSLEPQHVEGGKSSWAYVVAGIAVEDVQKELDLFNNTTGGSDVTKVFISAADKKSVSVTGPPSRLKNAFLFSNVLRYSRHYALPVYGGLCHAPHIYGPKDTKAILSASRELSRPVRLPLLSPMHGSPFEAATAGELYAAVVSEILTGTIFLGNLETGICEALSMATRCDLLQLGKTIVSEQLVAAIQSTSSHLTLVHQDVGQWSAKEPLVLQPASPKQSKLAIVGMSCRLPGGANDTELFWDLMVDGRDVHTEVPPDRFDLSTHLDASGQTPNATQTPFGNFIDRPGFFDAGFFNMSPREAEQTDPMHRLALVTAYEALEMAGYSPNRTPSTALKRVGTFYGQASDDWRELNAGQNIGTYAVPGGERAFANGRINYFFKFGGPSFNIDTACSSGLAAVQAACSALWAGEADTVLAGGLSVITNPDNYCMLCRGFFLSKTGQCKVWDKSADGYCRADGVGSVVIKRLEDAEADNDNILAVVAAGATNHSAEAISITHPHAGAQMDNYRQVMNAAGVDPLDVSYVELHGTGTQSGDAVESESVAGVFAPLSPRRRPDQRLHLGAVKSNIGHGEAAAGIASLMKVLLVFQKEKIPPHVGIVTELNPVVARNLDQRNAGLVLETTPWPRQVEGPAGRKRYVLVNSFGAHGGNTTILLEDAPARERGLEDVDPRSTHVMALSAKSKPSLRSNIDALLRYLQDNPSTQLGDLSYTLCARRIHHHTRIAVSASSVDDLHRLLTSARETVGDLRPAPTTPPSVAFAFTGQGAYYEGISAQLFQHFPFYREEILQLDELVRRLGFPPVVPHIAGGEKNSAGQASNPSTLETQLSTLVVEIALSRFWEFMGVVPSAVIGHSLGEYAAFVAAGVLSAADAIFLVGRRAQLVEKTCASGSHVMLSVRGSIEDIKDSLRQAGENGAYQFEVSCVNGPRDTVISGKRADIDDARTSLESQGLKCLLLDVPYAFHTAQLDPMLSVYEETARHITFKTPRVPILSPLLGDVVFDGKTINATYLRRASREPVNFVGALEAARDMGIVDEGTIWVDVGPHPICTGFIRNALSSNARVVPSLRRGEDDFTTFSGAMAALHSHGVPVEWNEYFRPYERAHKLLNLPAYRWNEKNYWIQYEGTWTLDKAYPSDKKPSRSAGLPTTSTSSLRTSSVQQVISEEVTDSHRARLTAVSDIQHPSLLAAVHGHQMNGHGVATSSIWADMALTVGEHLHRLLKPDSLAEIPMNISQMEVLHAQVANEDSSKSQLIQIRAEANLAERTTMMRLHNVDAESGVPVEEAFASATIRYEDPAAWKREWDRVAHLVKGRIEDLARRAASDEEPSANRLSRSMAYELFRNVVDYSDKYRGMRSVVLEGHEAFADVTLLPETHGSWHSPPHWIDGVFHIGGFVLNGSDASNTRDFFYVTPGWGDCRMLRRFEPGARYRTYVRMSPFPAEPNMYAGDVYVLQNGEIVGMMGEMKFRRVPRLLMGRFFSPSGGSKADGSLGAKTETTRQIAGEETVKKDIVAHGHLPAIQIKTQTSLSEKISPLSPTLPSVPVAAAAETPDNSAVGRCLNLIARETGLEVSRLTPESSFVELGIDSLMSLVLSEKFRTELQLEVKSSLFLECENIGELKAWLSEFV